MPARNKPQPKFSWWALGAVAAVTAVVAGISLQDRTTGSGDVPPQGGGQQVNSPALPPASEETTVLPLSPGVPERVRLRAGTNLVLRLTVPDDLPKGQAYRVQLGTNSGEIVWTTEVVMPELGGPVSVSLPADATAPQAYILRFMSSDSIDSAPQATYSYEISR